MKNEKVTPFVILHNLRIRYLPIYILCLKFKCVTLRSLITYKINIISGPCNNAII